MKRVPLAGPVIITITSSATPEIIDMFPEMEDSNVILRVSGQNYGPNRV